MTEVYKTLATGAASGDPSTLYTVPTGKQAVIRRISLVPPAGGLTAVRLWAGGNPMMNYMPLAAAEWCEWEGSLTLNAGELIQAQGATTATFVISGVEITP